MARSRPVKVDRPDAVAKPAYSGGSYKLLLVEDSPSDARLVIEMLHDAEHARFDLARATRLDEALRRIAKGGIDCVLLDILLPDSMGLDTFRRLKEQAPDLPIIILSGLGDDEVGDQLLTEGALAHLVKGTFEPAQLERTILQAIRAEDQERSTDRDFQRKPLPVGRELLGNVLDHLPDAVVVIDDVGQIRYANAIAAGQLGLEVGDFPASLNDLVGDPGTRKAGPLVWRPGDGSGEHEVRVRQLHIGREVYRLVVLREL